MEGITEEDIEKTNQRKSQATDSSFMSALFMSGFAKTIWQDIKSWLSILYINTWQTIIPLCITILLLFWTGSPTEWHVTIRQIFGN